MADSPNTTTAPDADISALYAAFQAKWKEIDEAPPNSPDANERFQRFFIERLDLENRILAIPATSVQGIAAKLGVWAKYDHDEDIRAYLVRSALADARRLSEGP